MPIASSDIQYRLSGGTGNTSPAASLGGAMSTAGGGLITDNAANNLWDDVTGDEAAAGDIEYRGIYVKNNHGSLTLQGAVVWFNGTAGEAPSNASRNFDMALADEAVTTTIETIANESTAPVGPSFSRPTTKGGGLQLNSATGLITQAYKGLWIRRTIIAGATAANDTVAMRVEGDTLP